MNRDEIWRLVFVLFLGQLVSFSLAASNFVSSYIVKLGANIPLTQSSIGVVFLALVYCSILLFRRQRFQVPFYWYIPLAFVDLQGTSLFAKAYQYSSITSITLLDCWTIPWVMILTYFALKARYSLRQYFGAAVCMSGLSLVFLSDAWQADTGGKNPLLGDALVIVATICYAFGNVAEEYYVKNKDFVELVAMVGLFRAVIGALEISVLERRELLSVNWSFQLVLLLAGFSAATFVFYSVTPLVLKMSGSTLFNLSLLTSDMWAIAIRVFFYGQKVDWLYYLAFGVVAIGLIIYSASEPSSAVEAAAEAANGDEHETAGGAEYEPLPA